MEQKIVVIHNFVCPWDMFKCNSKEDAKVVKKLLEKRFLGDTVKMSDAVKNMVKIETTCFSCTLKEYLRENNIQVI